MRNGDIVALAEGSDGSGTTNAVIDNETRASRYVQAGDPPRHRRRPYRLARPVPLC